MFGVVPSVVLVVLVVVSGVVHVVWGVGVGKRGKSNELCISNRDQKREKILSVVSLFHVMTPAAPCGLVLQSSSQNQPQTG